MVTLKGTAVKATKYPCKEIDGNTWYQFDVDGRTVGYSGPPGLKLRLLDETVDGCRTVTIVHADGTPVMVHADGTPVMGPDDTRDDDMATGAFGIV